MDIIFVLLRDDYFNIAEQTLACFPWPLCLRLEFGRPGCCDSNASQQHIQSNCPALGALPCLKCLVDLAQYGLFGLSTSLQGFRQSWGHFPPLLPETLNWSW